MIITPFGLTKAEVTTNSTTYSQARLFYVLTLTDLEVVNCGWVDGHHIRDGICLVVGHLDIIHQTSDHPVYSIQGDRHYKWGASVQYMSLVYMYMYPGK